MDHEFIVRVRLAHDEEFLRSCILKLYEHQEADEQQIGITHHENGVGFNKSDAGILSGYAEHLKKNRTLPSEQHADAVKRMRKYSKQLLTYLTIEEIE